MARKIANRQKGPTGAEFVTYHPATKVKLSGAGVLTKDEFDLIKKDRTILAMVEEGTLSFPQNAEMKKLAGTKLKRLQARNDRLSREQEDRKKQGAEDRDKDAEIAELRAENKAQGERMDKMEAMLNKSQQAKTGAPKPNPNASKPVANLGNNGNA